MRIALKYKRILHSPFPFYVYAYRCLSWAISSEVLIYVVGAGSGAAVVVDALRLPAWGWQLWRRFCICRSFVRTHIEAACSIFHIHRSAIGSAMCIGNDMVEIECSEAFLLHS
jgi:hypothetical protein